MRLLDHDLGVKGIVVGANFRFGYKAAGTTEDLARLGGERGIAVEVISLLEESEASVSSSRIRLALEEGRVEAAARLLGRNHVVVAHRVVVEPFLSSSSRRPDVNERRIEHDTATKTDIRRGMSPSPSPSTTSTSTSAGSDRTTTTTNNSTSSTTTTRKATRAATTGQTGTGVGPSRRGGVVVVAEWVVPASTVENMVPGTANGTIYHVHVSATSATTTTMTATTTTMDDTIDDASPASSVFEGEMVSWTTAEGDVVLGMSADEAAVWHEFATSTSTTTSGEAAPTTFTLSISYLDASPP